MEELDPPPEGGSERAGGRAMLRQIFLETLQAIQVRDVFERNVCCDGGTLRIADLTYELTMFRRVLVVTIGKAAKPSVDAVVQQIRPCLPLSCSLQVIGVGPGAPDETASEIEWWPGSHPVPDEGARAAARRISEVLRDTTSDDLVLFLISGGASAMVEMPLDESISVEEMAEFYRVLVTSGLKIAEMNTLRKHVSAVKGGRMAQMAERATQCTLLVSDVPEGMADVIGSGPTLPDSSTREECWEMMTRTQLRARLPERVSALLQSAELPETPKQGDACFQRSEFRVVLSTATMLEEAAKLCRARGFYVEIDNHCDEWEYREAAAYLLNRLHKLMERHERACLLSGGEILVDVGNTAGRGGRNQQFALYCATLLEGSEYEVAVLSAGTDGIDGNSPAAGAVVDATTVQRAKAVGLDVSEALRRFESYTLLDRIGDTIMTGSTGNNVRDLRVVMARRRSLRT